jgi:hypothetical protein
MIQNRQNSVFILLTRYKFLKVSQTLDRFADKCDDALVKQVKIEQIDDIGVKHVYRIAISNTSKKKRLYLRKSQLTRFFQEVIQELKGDIVFEQDFIVSKVFFSFSFCLFFSFSRGEVKVVLV